MTNELTGRRTKLIGRQTKYPKVQFKVFKRQPELSDCPKNPNLKNIKDNRNLNETQ